MDIVELQSYRRQLFEAIEYKTQGLYKATRSIKYAEEMREYVFVILSLMHDYLEVHKDHFTVRRRFPSSPDFGNVYKEAFIGATDPLRLKVEGDIIRPGSGSMIRGHIAWLFSKILETHCILEGWNYKYEYSKRYSQIGSMDFIKLRKAWSGGSRRRGGGGGGFGTKIENWSGQFRAKSNYDCIFCPEQIHAGEIYEKEVIRLGDIVEVLRSHITCPVDPNDPRGRNEEEDGGENVIELKNAA